MDTDQLIAFERVVRRGSFSAAARALDLSQPTITARIQALEQEIGGPLFVRGGRQLELTELGASFLPYVQRVLELLAQGVEAAGQAQSGQRGQIRLGVTESLAAGFLAATVAACHAENPQIEFFIRTGHTSQIAEMLHDGLIKLGLLTWPYFSPQLAPLLTFREDLVLVVSPKHPLAEVGPMTLDEARPLLKPFLLLRWSASSMSFFARLDLSPADVLELPLETTRYWLRYHTGCALLPRTLVNDELANGSLKAVTLSDAGPLFRESALVRLTSTPTLGPTLTEFVDSLARYATRLGIIVTRA